jgi:uncharacterized protein YydD (DUF2326 family)
MKLIKVFSNKNFKNVKFNSHFNVVIATITDKTIKKDTHNLGKTSLIHVIDFLLLGKFEHNKGLLSNKVFQGQIFYLEIELNNGQFIIIKRAIDYPTKLSFKTNDIQLSDFTPPSTWDSEDIPFDRAKELLNKFLGFDILTKWNYRKSITYFLRTQQDYLDVFQLGKFKGKYIDWKPFVFEMLGFNGDLIEQKLQLEAEAKEKTRSIKILQEEANIKTEQRDEILGQIDIKEQEKKIAEHTIDKFNFFINDSSLNKEVIDDLDSEIQTLNTERYRLGYEISKIKESLEKSVSEVNLSKLKELYKEVQLYFPNELCKQYEDLEKFNIAISKERQKFLKENLEKLTLEFTNINREIQLIELDKSEKLSFLTESDSYAKFKTYQKQLSLSEAKLEQLKDRLSNIDKSVKIELEIKEINKQIDRSRDSITNAINDRKHAEINCIFNQVISDILGTNALISIKQNKSGNVEFSAQYVNSQSNISTSEADGTSYKKLLCMAFDLSLLIYYSKNSFYRFVYHDGILEGLDSRIKIRLLEKVKSICDQYNIQHIITLIDSDVPSKDNGFIYTFTQNEICLELNDKNDEGKLFLQSF